MAVIKLNEGNPVSMNLPPSIDSFLQDVAQVTEKITYTDISNFEKRCTKSDFSQLRKLRRKFADAMEDWDDEATDAIGQKVADIVLGTETTESIKKEGRSIVDPFDEDAVYDSLSMYIADHFFPKDGISNELDVEFADALARVVEVLAKVHHSNKK